MNLDNPHNASHFQKPGLLSLLCWLRCWLCAWLVFQTVCRSCRSQRRFFQGGRLVVYLTQANLELDTWARRRRRDVDPSNIQETSRKRVGECASHKLISAPFACHPGIQVHGNAWSGLKLRLSYGRSSIRQPEPHSAPRPLPTATVAAPSLQEVALPSS